MKSTDSPEAASLIKCSKRRGSTLALDNLSLSVPRGGVTVLLGSNGAGKSTSIALLTGQLSPDSGTARLFGQDPRRPSARAAMGVMLQIAGLPSQLSVREQVALFSSYYTDPRPIDETISLADLQGIQSRRCRALSGGQQRRLQFALAICGRPKLLVLDEPTTGLDIASRRMLWDAVQSEVACGTAVLLTTHMLEEADALADHVVVIADGRVRKQGSPAEIKACVGGSTIRCRTTISADRLLSLPGVETCSGSKSGRVAIMTNSAPDTLRALLALDGGVQDIDVSGATLEDAVTLLATSCATEKAA